MSAAPWAPAPPPEAATGDTGDCACRRPEGEPLPRPWPRMSEAERAAWLARNLTDEARAAGERAQRDAEEAAASAGRMAEVGGAQGARRPGGWAQLLTAAASVRHELEAQLREISRGPEAETDAEALRAASLDELHRAAYDLQAWVAGRRRADAAAEAARAERAAAWDAGASRRVADVRAGFEAARAGVAPPVLAWTPEHGPGSQAWLRAYAVGELLRGIDVSASAPARARKKKLDRRGGVA